MSFRATLIALAFLVAVPRFARADQADARPNLASFGAGALIVSEPEAFDAQWSGFWLLDEDPTTGWAPPKGKLGNKVFVVELADRDEISELAFDTAKVDGSDGTRGAKDVTVEISDKADGGWQPLATATLAKSKDDQRTAVKTPKTGRYLRVTITSNQGDADYVELMGFAAYGKVVDKKPMPPVSGAFDSNFGTFRVLAQGTSATGCYEHKNGLIQNGGFDGRVLRFTWHESVDGKPDSGPAVLVFPADGKTFLGLWWRGTSTQRHADGRWDGKLSSSTVGACPHYKPGTGNAIQDALKADGRARAYGIQFDVDSDHLKDDSKATLDQLVAALKAESWKVSIEGHTDSTSTAKHNQELSEKRAAAVKAYLVKAGIAESRLSTVGYGATKPVSTNDTALGRSQNRRVEIVKQ